MNYKSIKKVLRKFSSDPYKRMDEKTADTAYKREIEEIKKGHIGREKYANKLAKIHGFSEDEIKSAVLIGAQCEYGRCIKQLGKGEIYRQENTDGYLTSGMNNIKKAKEMADLLNLDYEKINQIVKPEMIEKEVNTTIKQLKKAGDDIYVLRDQVKELCTEYGLNEKLTEMEETFKKAKYERNIRVVKEQPFANDYRDKAKKSAKENGFPTEVFDDAHFAALGIPPKKGKSKKAEWEAIKKELEEETK